MYYINYEFEIYHFEVAVVVQLVVKHLAANMGSP